MEYYKGCIVWGSACQGRQVITKVTVGDLNRMLGRYSKGLIK